jgi:hypothetical protein
MKLHELTADVLAIQQEDLPEDVLADTLESIQGEFEDKGIALGSVVQNIEAEIDALKAHKATIDQKIKTRTNKIAWLKNYLRENMTASGINKIECPLFSVTMRKPSKTVVVDDEDLVPDDYMSVKVVTAPDKKAIAAALKEGEEIPGCRLAEGQAGIIIK